MTLQEYLAKLRPGQNPRGNAIQSLIRSGATSEEEYNSQGVRKQEYGLLSPSGKEARRAEMGAGRTGRACSDRPLETPDAGQLARDGQGLE